MLLTSKIQAFQETPNVVEATSQTYKPTQSWRHRAIAIMKDLPLLKGLAALLERHMKSLDARNIAKSAPLEDRVNPLMPSWRKQLIEPHVALEKMWKNGKKAILEHMKKDPIAAYVPPEKALSGLNVSSKQPSLPPLQFTYEAAEAQGPRATMEDAHFFTELEQGAITGVFDGHGGSEVAKFACSIFPKTFSRILAQAKGNVHFAFESAFEEVQKEISKHKNWNEMGCTAVICFINRHTRQIITATAGDSEANFYSLNDESKMESLPLSCVRDWSSKKDALRAATALNRLEFANEWPLVTNAKYLRYPSRFYGVNVSRGFGDLCYQDDQGKTAITHKPKITINSLKQGILILACDGLKDYVPENEIIQQIANGNPNLAQRLVDYAIKEKHAKDNVTVVAINIAE